MMDAGIEVSSRQEIAFQRRNQLGRIALGLVVALGVSACVSPYVEPGMARPGVARENGKVKKDSNGVVATTPVTVAQASAYGRSLQEAYRGKARTLNHLRRWLDIATIGAAASTIGLAATGGSTSAITGVGIGGGALGLAGLRLIDRRFAPLYFQGGRIVECLIQAAEGHSAVSPQIMSLVTAAADLRARTEDWREGVDELEDLLRDKPGNGFVEAERTQIAELDRVRRLAEQSVDSMAPLGRILLSKIEHVRLTVDEQVSRMEPDTLAFDEALRSRLRDSAGVQDIQAPDQNLGKPEDTAAGALTELGGGSKEEKEALEEVETARKNAEEARQVLIDAWEKAAADPQEVPGTLFDACTLREAQLDQEPLRIVPERREATVGVDNLISGIVAGGRPPYTVVSATLPTGVDEPTVDAAGNLTLSIPQETATKGQRPILVLVKDQAGAMGSMTIDFPSE